jgi:hypothetical protein
MKYRKKPVIIEAKIFYCNAESYSVLAWINEGDWPLARWENFDLIIPTLEGEMKARPGDYIIKGIKGEFYPCKPDIFEATYEPVNGEGND